MKHLSHFPILFAKDDKNGNLTYELTCRRVGLLMIIDQEPIIAKSGRFSTPQAVGWSVG